MEMRHGLDILAFVRVILDLAEVSCGTINAPEVPVTRNPRLAPTKKVLTELVLSESLMRIPKPKLNHPRLTCKKWKIAVLFCLGCTIVQTLLSRPGRQYSKIKTTPLNASLTELPPLVVFYHIFVPLENEGANRAENIIQEQIHDLGNGLSKSLSSPAATVYYTVVGKKIEEDFVSQICDKFPTQISSCIMLQYLESGYEEHTMQPLFEHCQEHQDHRVIYLHTNGSYNASERPDRLRQHATQAVVSPECIVTAAREQCDLCGLLFSAQPSNHFVGNIFNAKCSYIGQLIPPMEFGGRMDKLLDAAKVFVENGSLTLNGPGWALEPWSIGTGRFAMEHWPGSHPLLEKVCDLANKPEREYWEQLPVGAHQPEDWGFQRFPRESVWCPASEVKGDHCSLDFIERKKMYFLLPGRIFKWDFLYGEVPMSSSWTWSVYPDGKFWRDQVTIHGSKAFAAETAATDDFNDLWNGRVRTTIKDKKTVKTSLVVTFCSGNLHWLKNFTDGFVFDHTFVAVKCGIQPDKDTLPENATLVSLPNVGGCDHTMAYWMSNILPTLSRAYNQDDMVVFVKDSLVHFPAFNVRDFKATWEIATSDQGFGCFLESSCGFSFYSDLKVLRKFSMRGYVRNSLRTAKKDVGFKSSYDNLDEWHRALGITVHGPYIPVCYGGMYIVKRAKIEAVPMELLRNLTTNLARGNNIEEGHFAERTWAALLMDNLSFMDQLRLHERARGCGTKRTLLGALRLDERTDILWNP